MKNAPSHIVEVKNINFAALRFELNIPHGVSNPQALLILVLGSNGDGTGMCQDPFWIAYAMKRNLALVGCHFQDHDVRRPIEGYVEDIESSGEALLEAISVWEHHKRIPQNLNLLLWGHSAGGEFNYEFNNWCPERVLAFVVNKGGCYKTGLCSKEARLNPGMFFYGIHDLERRVDVVKGLWRLNAQVGCNWTLVTEDCHHEVHNSETLSLDMFDKALEDPTKMHAPF